MFTIKYTSGAYAGGTTKYLGTFDTEDEAGAIAVKMMDSGIYTWTCDFDVVAVPDGVTPQPIPAWTN